MALRDEQADILGGPILQRPESSVFATFAQYHLAFKSVILIIFGLLVWIACVRGLEHLKKHRELRYRKAMRRKHGIPDSDCRPFAVAYAAAKRAHLEREAQDRKETTNYMSDHNPPAVGQRTDARKDARGLRRRVPEATVQHHDYQLPVKHVAVYDSKRQEPDSLNFADRYNPDSCHRMTIPPPPPVEWPPVRRASRKALVINLDDNEESRKRSFEDEGSVERGTMKKSRIASDELVGSGEQADWYAQYSDEPPSKRYLERQHENDYAQMGSQERTQHASGHPDGEHEFDETMEGVNEGEVTKLGAVGRGKKRDRAEAGSTFGGDDDADTRNGRALHHRKRRTIVRRTMEVPTRGQKRDREAESLESAGEGDGCEASQRRIQHSPQKKRGKKAVSGDATEILVEDPRVSQDPLCGGRKVGDEWADGDTQYKVGDKGDRLRLTLVKKAKNKYHMPQDSQHPDRSAALEIYVETWMTEEQYKRAEGGQELAWQEAPKESSGSRTPDVFDSPMKNGKNLLWDSVRGSPARPSFRQFIPTGTPTRVNSLEQWRLQPTTGRRVASSNSLILPGVADSPSRPGFRGFSKWEKQDREADAMARIRAKVEEEKKVQFPPQKTSAISTSVTAPELVVKPLSVPTITLTLAPTVGAESGSDDSTRQGKANAPTPSSMAPDASDSTKGNIATASASTPQLPLSSTSPAATTATLFPGAPSPSAATSSVTLSPFSFAKPTQSLLSASPATSSSTVPNFFEKVIGAGAPSSSIPSPSTIGGTTQPNLSSSESVSKSASLSFAKPDLASPTSTAITSVAKSPAPFFAAASGFSPSSTVFGSTPVASKVESSLPPSMSISPATSESLKPAAPLFSFSGTSPSTIALPTSSTLSGPKFSFGQASATSAHMPSSNLNLGTTSQTKPTFQFGRTSPGVTNGASASSALATDESKKLATSVPAFGATANPHEFAKPSLPGTTTVFGNSSVTSPLPPTTNLFGKLVIENGEASTSALPKPTLAPASTTTLDNAFSSAPSAPTLGSTPAFSFGINAGSRPAEGSKPTSLFGGAAGGPSSVSTFSGSSTGGKPTFTFGISAAGSKPSSIFSGNMENTKPPPAFGGPIEGSRLAFAFGGSTEISKPAPVFGGSAGESKPTIAFGGTTKNKPTSGPTTES